MATPQLAIPHQESLAPESRPPHSPKSMKPSESCLSVLRLSLVANLPKPKTDVPASIIFPSPIPASLGMQTARAFHREQLLEYRLRWEERCQQQIKEGLTPTTLTTSWICNHVQGDVVPLNTATDIPPHLRRHHPYLSDLDPHQPGTWSTLTSTVQKLQRWLINCPVSSKKTMKIPLRFRRPTLPKGWVYNEEPEEGLAKDKAGPSTLSPPSSPTTTSPLTHVGPHRTTRGALRRRHPQALNITEELPTSPSTSPTARDGKSQHGISKST